MTSMPHGFPRAPGTVWVASRGGALYRTTSEGLLRRVGDDNPNGARDPYVVWAEVGPLVPAPGLAAARRRSAHEVQRSPNGVPQVEVVGYADWLYDRAEQVSQP